MREIKFRARDAITGHWRYGYYYKSKGNHIIRDDEDQESIVLEKTVGQYAGLKDKNGIKIFKGDILDFTTFDHNDSDIQWRGIVKFCCEWQIWKTFDNELYGDDGPFHLGIIHSQDDEIEIIGNIYENPELLK